MPRPKCILIVEDETLTAMALGTYLEDQGHRVLGFSATGEDAVQKANSEKPDLIIMDLRLAGKMDGMQAARLIEATRQIPIVIISGYSDEFVYDHAAGYKPAAFLAKPINYQEIDDILKSLG